MKWLLSCQATLDNQERCNVGKSRSTFKDIIRERKGRLNLLRGKLQRHKFPRVNKFKKTRATIEATLASFSIRLN